MPITIPFLYTKPLEYTRNALTQARSLMTSGEGDLVSFKIRPISRWPVESQEEMEMVDAYVYPSEYGKIQEYLSLLSKRREGLVNGPATVYFDGLNELIFVEHETGPEIIAFVGLATAAIGFGKTIVELILTIVKTINSSNEVKNAGKLTERNQIVAAVMIEERTKDQVRTIKVIILPATAEELDQNKLLKTLFP